MPRENIYLGTVVPDIGKPGLDKIAEVEGISRAIYEDYINRRINYNKAIRRLNLLSLIVTRDSDFDGEHPRLRNRALNIIDYYRRKLMKARHKVKHR